MKFADGVDIIEAKAKANPVKWAKNNKKTRYITNMDVFVSTKMYNVDRVAIVSIIGNTTTIKLTRYPRYQDLLCSPIEIMRDFMPVDLSMTMKSVNDQR